MKAPLLTMRGMVKSFAGAPALRGVDFDLRPGEIHALLGENGAGKSTLMNIVSGLLRPDAGEMTLGGRGYRPRSPRAAAAAGVGMVHQHFMLAPSLTVAENVALAVGKEFLLTRRRLRRRVNQLADELGWELDDRALVETLPVGHQQRVELLRALAIGCQVLVLDEPTAVLSPPEVDELFAVLDRLRSEGVALVFITHKLDEVLRLSDRVTVLRAGRVVGVRQTDEVSVSALAAMMVGGEMESASSPQVFQGAPVLMCHRLVAAGRRGTGGLGPISLTVHAGECVGIAGVDGNGQRELAECLAGLRPWTSGRCWLGEHRVPAWRAADRRRLGVGYIPQDRRADGLAESLSIADNTILERHAGPPFARCGVLRLQARDEAAAGLVEAFDVRAPSTRTLAGELSGGNQQKVVVGRVLTAGPRLVVAHDPTRGLDIAAAAFVHQQLHAARARGAGVLLISTDLDEVLAHASPVLVLYRGRVVGVSRRPHERRRLGLWMGGRRDDAP